MTTGAPKSNAIALWAQVGGALTALAALAFWPPAHGRMLVVPVAPGMDAGLAALVIERGALLLGPGAFPGSLIVLGDRDRVMRGMLGHGVIAIAAPSMLCGATA